MNTIRSRITFLSTFTLLFGWVASTLPAQDPVFSGPQVGEPLPGFQVAVIVGDDANSGKDVDTSLIFDDQPTLLIFFHERTRPAFGLMRAVTNFAEKRKGMKSMVVFLTDDATETQQWAKNISRYFSKGTAYGISTDGKEGPGAYGLNRNVTLTVLVADQGKVTANFALVQPQLQTDGPKILRAVADVTGGGEIPDVRQLDPRSANRMNQGGGRNADSKLANLLRAVISKRATASQVTEAVKKVDEYISESETGRKELARITRTIVGSGKLANYGTAEAQEALQKWNDRLSKDPSSESKE